MSKVKTERMVPTELQIFACETWLRANTNKTKNINLRFSSYTLKHLIQKDANFYIPNDAVVQAARRLGLRERPTCVPDQIDLHYRHFNIGFGRLTKQIFTKKRSL